MKIDIIVDEKDKYLLEKYTWYLNCGYARTDKVVAGKKKRMLLHRIILGVDGKNWKNSMVDHINRNKLDNRRCNLRLSTSLENNRNVGVKSNNSSGFKGVSISKGGKKWRSRIVIDGKEHRLGTHDTKEQAAVTYNDKALEIFGEFAYLNKIKL